MVGLEALEDPGSRVDQAVPAVAVDAQRHRRRVQGIVARMKEVSQRISAWVASAWKLWTEGQVEARQPDQLGEARPEGDQLAKGRFGLRQAGWDFVE